MTMADVAITLLVQVEGVFWCSVLKSPQTSVPESAKPLTARARADLGLSHSPPFTFELIRSCDWTHP
jgi:hypothetical protein